MRQQGFTLLELMVAMAIFAMLAVAGWQVFDGVNRARERAQLHADELAVLQYAYLQVQQDMAQMIPYQVPPTQTADDNPTNNTPNNANNSSPNKNNAHPVTPFMALESTRLRFMRYADPDPRYQTSPSIQRIEYVFMNESLIRRQYTSLQVGQEPSQDISLDTVLLSGASAGRWQAYLPEVSDTFPSADVSSTTQTSTAQNSNVNQNSKLTDNQAGALLLPKGVGLSFSYQDTPITWQWALTPQPIPQ